MVYERSNELDHDCASQVSAGLFAFLVEIAALVLRILKRDNVLVPDNALIVSVDPSIISFPNTDVPDTAPNDRLFLN